MGKGRKADKKDGGISGLGNEEDGQMKTKYDRTCV